MNAVIGVATPRPRFVASIVCASGSSMPAADGRARIGNFGRFKEILQGKSTGVRLAAGSRLIGAASRHFAETLGGPR